MKISVDSTWCRYHYDPLDRLTFCASVAPINSQRFYLKQHLSTEIRGLQQRSIMQYEDQLLAQHRGQAGTLQTHLLATDQQRSLLALIDATRAHLLVYSPYGHRVPENGLLSLLGFNGERPDPVTGCYLLGNGYRAFNPVLMRFNSPDTWSPFGRGGLNAYGYCVGDPVNRSDPTGHWSWGNPRKGFLNWIGWRVPSRARPATTPSTSQRPALPSPTSNAPIYSDARSHAPHAQATTFTGHPSSGDVPSMAHIENRPLALVNGHSTPPLGEYFSSPTGGLYSIADKLANHYDTASLHSKISVSSGNVTPLGSRRSSANNPLPKQGPLPPLPAGVSSKTTWSYPAPDYSADNIYERLPNKRSLFSRCWAVRRT